MYKYDQLSIDDIMVYMVSIANVMTLLGVIAPLLSRIMAIEGGSKETGSMKAPLGVEMPRSTYTFDDHLLLFQDYPTTLSSYKSINGG